MSGQTSVLTKPLQESHPLESKPALSEILNRIRPSALSVDVTNACNLRCKHCFWDSYNELIQEKMNLNIIAKVKAALAKYSSITNITWYGGEPLLNATTRRIVAEGIRLNKKNNLVISNGTFSIPAFEGKYHVAVSLDGVEKIHDEIRGKGVYKKAKKHIQEAIAKQIPVGLIYCINALNLHCIPEFLEEWAGHMPDGIAFTCFAPLKTKPSYLKISDEQRDRVSDLLIAMKHRYGRLICNSPMMLELLKTKYGTALAEHCPMNVLGQGGRVDSIHMCNDGSIRVPCALGPDADCVQCRSVTTVALYAGKVLKDKESLRALFYMYHSKSHVKTTRAVP